MSAPSALAYLALASARGRLRQLARRVRSPRHFLGMAAGAAWLGYVFLTQRIAAGRVVARHGALDAAWVAELGVLVTLVITVVVAWLFVSEGYGLGFSPAEGHFLFAAPLRRRSLVLYKLALSAAGSLMFAVLLVAVFGRGGPAQRATAVVGGWLTMTTVNLHVLGATLTRVSLTQHRVAAVRRRLATLAVAAATVTAAAVGWRRAPPLEAFASAGLAGIADWTRALADTAPLSWALYPLRAPADAAFASTPGAFLAALPGAVAVVALHALWVISSDAAFEEAAIESARRLAARVDALRAGAIPVLRRSKRRRSFSLGARGRPELALAWKALVRGTRFVSLPVVVAGLAALSFGVTALVVVREGRGGGAELVAFFALVLAAMAALFGPFVLTGDLRRDASNLELLRALPLRGREVLLGEMAAPFATTVLVEWILVATWLALAGRPFPADPGDRAALALAMAIGGPAVSAATFVVANGLVVLYPDWAGTAPSPREVFGARNLVGLATTLLAAVALVPAAIAGGLVGLATAPFLGTWGIGAGCAAGAGVVAVEVAIAVRILGRAFERIDAAA